MAADFHATRVDDVTVVALHEQYDNLDTAELEAVAKDLLALAQSANPPLIVFDFAATKFFGSAFLGCLFRVWRRLITRQGKMACCNAHGICRQVLQVTQVDRLWPICDSLDAAVRSVKT